MRRLLTGLAALSGVAVFAACDAGNLPTSSEELSGGTLQSQVSHEDAVCYTMNFDDQDPALEHGDEVTSITTSGTGFGFSLAVDVSDINGSAIEKAVVYDTDNVGGPDFDLEWDGTDAECAPCEGQENVLVIEDALGFEDEGDAEGGGRITFTGFSGNGTFFIRSAKAVDDDVNEATFEFRVDGTTLIGESTAAGNGTVETIDTDETEFFNQFSVEYRSSGALDDVEICKLPEPEEPGGGEGCTPGYWRQPHHFDDWTNHAPGDDLASVFTIPGDLELERPESADPEDISLHDAVTLRGGGVNALLRHAVAALLNAANPDVSYDLTESEIIDMVNDALAGVGDLTIQELKDELEEFNEQGCPL